MTSQQREILEVLAQSQDDDRDPYVTTPGHHKQCSRYRIPAIPIWFGIISGAFLLTAWFAVMIGFNATIIAVDCCGCYDVHYHSQLLLLLLC
jgi:hypothetical protein